MRFITNRSIICLILFFISNYTYSQTVNVTGKVIDSNDGTELIGVTIVEKGTSNGAISDVFGNYSVNVAQGATLVFSYVGYINQEIIVGSETIIDVNLVPDLEQLEEVVVIGYGNKKKQDLTGVVANVSSKDFNKGAIVSSDQLISGKIAGVQITSNSGEPGGQTSIRIRGGTSVNASNEPLYVIDGVPIDNSPTNPDGFNPGRNPLNFLNANDIESFTVLKDASATAIYGSRGANGVIIINTKKGGDGADGRISYSSWISFAEPINRVEVLNAEQFRDLVAERSPQRLDLIGNSFTDWQSIVTQIAVGQNHSLSFSGGNENGGYRISLGYLDQEGIVKTTETERISYAMNYGHKLLNGDLKLDLNVKASYTADRFNDGEALSNAVGFAPTQPVFDINSPFAGYWEWPLSFGNGISINPLSVLEQIQDTGESFRSIGNIQFEYQIPWVEGLSTKLNLGYDVIRGERSRFVPTTSRRQFEPRRGEVRNQNQTRFNQLLDFYFTYRTEIQDNSNLDFTLGYSYQNFENRFPSQSAFILTTDILGPDNPSVGTEFQVNNSVLENRLISFFGRMNYSLKDKYLLTGSLRRDGSSRFGPDNRWGWFPSAAIAWKISNEEFIDFGEFVNELKLRVGWGITGNQEIGDFAYVLSYQTGNENVRVPFGNDLITTVSANAADPRLQWEQTESWNLGLDYALWEARLSGSLEYYFKKTDELLFEINVPAGSNLSNRVLSNIGSVENQGIELSLNVVAIEKENLSVDFGINAARNTNEITDLFGADDPNFLGIETGQITGAIGATIQRLNVGLPVNTFFVFEHRKNEDGSPIDDKTDRNGDGLLNDLDMYVDQNGDGTISIDDRIPFRDPAPDWILGFSGNVTYKDFDLNFTLRGSIGNYVYNNVASWNGHKDRVADNVPGNAHISVLETNFTVRQPFSNLYVEDASFLRMDNLTLGYNVPIKSGKLNARLYSTIQNLFVITNYSGLDPEIGNASSNNLNPRFGIDENIFPRSRSIIFGLNLNF